MLGGAGSSGMLFPRLLATDRPATRAQKRKNAFFSLQRARGTGTPDLVAARIAGNPINPPRLNQGWHTQFLTKFQKLDGFRELVAWRVCPGYGAIALRAQNRPPGIGPKLACARPLSRRKTSFNGHNILSTGSSRHALQLSSYKRPLKRPLTRPNRP